MDDHSPQWTRCTPPFFTHQQSYFEWRIHEMSPVQIAPWHGWYSPMSLFISPSGLLRSLKLLGLLLGFLQLISLRLPSGNQFHGWKITTSMVFAAIDHLFRWCSIIFISMAIDMDAFSACHVWQREMARWISMWTHWPIPSSIFGEPHPEDGSYMLVSHTI